ncbi:MAG TPA: SRPBCC family protein [Candidatus Udaeobacter sp.]|nr:SRPBCC family protein [Candidatus Udaeobacter sp.]
MPRAGPKMNGVQGSIVVNAPVDSVYRHWLRLEHVQKFIAAVKEVKELDANHFMIAVSHKGQRYEGVLEIVLRVPERRLGWRVVARKSSSHHFATGVVSFTSRSDRSTGVSVRIISSFDAALSRGVNPYLRNFKRLIEKPA